MVETQVFFCFFNIQTKELRNVHQRKHLDVHILVKTCQHIEIAFGSKKKFVANNLIQIVIIIKNIIFAIIINIFYCFMKIN